jgi:K+-transporting ATPase ATPase C chain
MTRLIRNALTMLLVMTAITGLIYPLAATGVAQVLFPHQANGSLVVRDGKPIGSELIGQSFTDPKYFWGRPSATTPQPNNGTASNGSNLGPTNSALHDAVQQRLDALHAADPSNTAPVPADLVTASGSGLDPQISPAAAQYQVQTLVTQATQGRQLGLLGEPGVNVLQLNLALDGVQKR